MRTGMRTRRVVEVVFVVDAQQRNQNFIKIRTREPSLYMYVKEGHATDDLNIESLRSQAHVITTSPNAA